jgi:hypothetical protein
MRVIQIILIGAAIGYLIAGLIIWIAERTPIL